MHSSETYLEVVVASWCASIVSGGVEGRDAGGGVGVRLGRGRVMRCDEGGGVLDVGDAAFARLICSV